MLKQSDEVYNLSPGSFGCPEGERSDCRQGVTKVASDPRHELGYFQMVYPKFLDVGQCGKSAQKMTIEPLRGKTTDPIAREVILSDLELLDQGKQTKFVHMQECFGPLRSKFLGWVWVPMNDKGVMKMRNGGYIPRVTGQGTCEETGHVIDQMADDHFDDFQGKGVL